MNKYTAILGIAGASFLLSGCGGGDGSSSPATINYKTINSSAPATNSTSLTGIRGVNNSSNVYITGGAVTSSNMWTNQLYVGPINGGGVYYTLNVPGSNSTTNSYSVDNWLVNQVKVVGNSTINNVSRGFLYQGPVANNDGVGTVGTAPWYDITYSSGGTVFPSIPHSVMNNIVVGGYQAGGITAYICDITTPSAPVCDNMNSIFPSTTLSSSAYGVWWNGGTSYTIVGGYSSALHTDLKTSNPVGSLAFIVDYDSSTRSYSNFTSYSFNNSTSGVASTHFEGITIDVTKGGYNLAGEGVLTNGTLPIAFVHISRSSNGGFNPKATWVPVAFPGASTTTADTVYQNNLLGVYKPGVQPLNGYVANIPTSLY